MSDLKLPYDQGWELFYRARYRDAISCLNQILEEDPNQPSVLSLLALSYAFLDDNNTAELHAARALAIDPETALAYTVRGYLLDDREESVLARQHHDQAIRIAPDDCFCRARSAWNYWLQDRRKEAILELDLLSASKPDCAYAYYFRGHILKKDEKYDDALRAYSKAIELRKDFTLAYYWRGLLYRDRRKYTEALNDFSKVLDLCPNHIDSLFQRGWCLAQLDRVDEAIAAYSAHIQHAGDGAYASAYNNRGSELKEKGDIAGARADFEQAIKLDHEYKYAWANLGHLKMTQGDLDGGAADLKIAVGLDAKYEWSLSRLREIYEKKGDYRSELAATAHVRQVSPQPQWTYQDADTQFFTETVFKHFTNVLLPAIQKNNERFVDYWEVRMMWGARKSQSIYQGTSSIVHEGKYGAGYIVLAEKNIWIVNIGELSKRYVKTTGLVGKFFLAALRNLDMTSAEKSDKVFCIPHSDIQYVNSTDGAIVLGTGPDSWQLFTWFSDVDNRLLAALDLARKDMVADLWKPIGTPPPRKPESVPASEDVYGQIEKLKNLLDMKAISQDQYDKKVQDLLSRL
ncbi:MAG: tetratricopeptide repeat protein [Anaerolineales bacterium]|nr:tetratricopeptide repeat protein [Anaerolineales bacterium]